MIFGSRNGGGQRTWDDGNPAGTFDVQGASSRPPFLVLVCVISSPGFGAVSGRFSFVAMVFTQIEDFFSLKWRELLDRHYGFLAISSVPFDAVFIDNDPVPRQARLKALLHWFSVR